MCLFAHAPYYKLNKGFFLGPPPGLNKKASEKYPLFITCKYHSFSVNVNVIFKTNEKAPEINLSLRNTSQLNRLIDQ